MKVRVFATSRYEKEVRRLLAEPEQAALQLAIAADPEAHPIVPGTGGVRKARWARQGRGKSGGVRVIYFTRNAAEEIVLLMMYAKAERDSMTAKQLLEIKHALDN